MTSYSSKRYAQCFLLFLVFVFHVTANLWVLQKSRVARTYDEGGRIYYGITYFQKLFLDPQPDIPAAFSDILTLALNQLHPHSFDFFEALSFKALDLFHAVSIERMIVVVNAIFLAVLLVSVYNLGSIIYGRDAGLLAAFLVSFFPIVFGQSRAAMLDYPTMCFVSLSMWMLYKTQSFSSAYFSAITGIAFGMAQLMKSSAMLFLSAPAVYFFCRSYYSGQKKKVFFNGVLFVFFFILVAGLVYLRKENLNALSVYHSKILYCDTHNNYLFYVANFWKLTGPFLFCLSLLPLAGYIWSIKKRDKLLLLWLFVPLILFSLSANKSYRFILPLLPAFALIVAGEIKTGKFLSLFRSGYGVSIVLAAAMQYMFLHCGFVSLGKYPQSSVEGGVMSVRTDAYASTADSLSVLFEKEAGRKGGEKKSIVYLMRIGAIHWPVHLYLLLHQLPYVGYCYTELDEADLKNYNYADVDWGAKIVSADYIVDKSGEKCIPGFVSFVEDLQRKKFEEIKDQFDLITQMHVFDGSSLFVYRKKTL